LFEVSGFAIIALMKPPVPDSGSSRPVEFPTRAADWLARAEQEDAALRARLALAQASGIRDEELLEGLRRLGVTPATLPALDLAPTILVGWADGAMSRLERDRLRALAVIRGVAESHPAWGLLQHWMLQRPSPHDERVLLAAVVARLDRLPLRIRLKRREAILRDCEAVARAAGRMLGGPKVSREERLALDELHTLL
jgi:hypothetical protein